MFEWKSSVVAAGVILLLASTGYADPIIIDDFTDGYCSISLAYSGGLPQDSGWKTVSATALGSYRSMRLQLVGPPSGGSGSSTARVDQANLPGALTWDEDACLDGVLMLKYDANGVGLGGIDLTSGGTASQFVFRHGTDAHTAALTIDVYDQSGGHSQLLTTLPSTPTTNIMTTSLFNFTSFSAVGTAADFTDADEVVFTISSATQGGGDYSFSLGEHGGGNVPEPATVILLAAGLGAAALARRHRLRR